MNTLEKLRAPAPAPRRVLAKMVIPEMRNQCMEKMNINSGAAKKPYQVNREWYIKLPRMMPQTSSFAQAHKINALSRMKCYPEMLLFSELRDSPDWAVADALEHFCHRFPTFVIAFFSKGRLWAKTARGDTMVPAKKVFNYPGGALAWLRTALAEQYDERFEADNELGEKAYETFYDSQYIQSRRNLKMQKRLMPMLFVEKGTPEWKSMREARFTKPNTTLRDFSGAERS